MTNDNQKNNSEEKPANNYLKFTGLGFQMIAIIGVFTFVGYKIDEYLKNQTQWVTALFGVLGVIIALYLTIKQISK